MKIYLDAKTSDENIRVNYITIIDKDHRFHTVDWDSTGCTIEYGDYCAEYEGVYIDGEYANGLIDKFRNATGFCICADNADTEEVDRGFAPYSLTVEDGDEIFEVPLQMISVEGVEIDYTREQIAKNIWDLFGDIPIDDNDVITEDFLQFPAGTSRFDVFEWIEQDLKTSVYELMFAA